MRLYLDEDCAEALLVSLLQQAGHDVQTHADAGLASAHDSVHLKHATREDRVLLSRNHDDSRFADASPANSAIKLFPASHFLAK